MTSEFSKIEAAELLGQVFQIKKKYPCKDDRYQDGKIPSGEVGKVTGIDFYNNEVKLNIDIYGNFYLVTKLDFEQYFVLLESSVTN